MDLGECVTKKTYQTIHT